MELNQYLARAKAYHNMKSLAVVMREHNLKQADLIKINANENPLGVSNKVKERVAELLPKMSVYPDDSYTELRGKLGALWQVKPEEVAIGCGSGELIRSIIRSKAHLASHSASGTPTKVLMAGATFPAYTLFSNLDGLEVIKTPSKTHNIDEFKHLYEQHQPDLVFICVPNNPLGECLDSKVVLEFLALCDEKSLLVVDGAYQEYAKFRDSDKEIAPKALTQQFPNAIYLGTFSKGYGLGGMRVGYGIGHAPIISEVKKFVAPFSVSSLSIAAALVALDDGDHLQHSLEHNLEAIKQYEALFEKKGIEYIQSYANFIAIIGSEKGFSTRINDALMTKGILVRDFPLINALRISMATPTQNERVLYALDQLL